MKLAWDGSHLGSFKKKIVLLELKIDKRYYILLQLKKKSQVFCIREKSKGSLACVIDELKPFFGLKKIGSHTIEIDKVFYNIYYVPSTPTGEMVWETPLNVEEFEFKRNEYFIDEMRKVLIFRDIMGIRQNFERNIICRVIDEQYYPISFNDQDNIFLAKNNSDNTKVSSSRVLYKWFGRDPMKDTYMRMIDNVEDDPIKKIHFYNRIKKEIERVDPNMIWLLNHIKERSTRKFA